VCDQADAAATSSSSAGTALDVVARVPDLVEVRSGGIADTPTTTPAAPITSGVSGRVMPHRVQASPVLHASRVGADLRAKRSATMHETTRDSVTPSSPRCHRFRA
jgi:hypothetical protein